ncbi:putative pectate lyase A [Rhizoctonia solani]|uniref:Putative pectate lyase A n=1 Tax=Rhizoctonia solani TaxID=456999 RepID=A0A0K6GA53_9AGAM|nr:putative pectate lyase A [Rhizoctonia solani]
MRFSVVSVSVLAALAQLVSAVPTLERRASATEKPTIGYAAQGGTTGGIGGTTVTVTSLAALTSAVADDKAKIVYVSGTISGNTVVKVGSNTSILGKSGASLVGVGLRVNKKSNVIIRNLKISKVLASAGDAVGIQEAFVDSNDGINTRLGAQLLVENNVWEGVKKPLYATDNGFAVARGNDFGGASNSAPAGTFSKAPYDYTLLDAGKVKSSVSSAGATLSF